MTVFWLIAWVIFGHPAIPDSTGWLVALIICALIDWVNE